MKEVYEKATLDIVAFLTEDVILSSPESSHWQLPIALEDDKP